MDNLITNAIAWPSVLAAVLIFGFAPGAVLRLIVLAYRRDDPRRTELLGELPHVPRVERPFWVAEQLEAALFEGLTGRAVALIGRLRRDPRERKAVAAPVFYGQTLARPTIQRLVLGGHLRRLREEAFITTEQAAAAIRGSHSEISRMEHGRVDFKEHHVEDLLTLYGVTAGDEREALLRLAREANTPGWWQGYSNILPHWVEPYFGLEAAASFIRTWELQFVPGLLQTEAYARAIIRLGNATSEEDVQRRAEARLARQDILNRDHPPRLWAVVDEGALRRSIGGRAVMQEQVRHLIKMAEHPAVTLQILPFQVGSHPAMGGPFTILRFNEPDLRDAVYIEQLTSAIYLDKSADVDSYLEAMEQLCLQAEPAAETQRLLVEILESL